MTLEAAGQRLPGFNRSEITVAIRHAGPRGQPVLAPAMGTTGPLPGDWRHEGTPRPKGLAAFGICINHSQ
eukprot:16438858-Heterocapsa_arctica.AAC.1